MEVENGRPKGHTFHFLPPELEGRRFQQELVSLLKSSANGVSFTEWAKQAEPSGDRWVERGTRWDPTDYRGDETYLSIYLSIYLQYKSTQLYL